METRPDRQKSNWLLDAILLLGFLLSFYLDFTGVSLHQWLGILGGALAAVHLLLHWGWVKAVTRRLLGHTSRQASWYYLLDGLIFLGIIMIVFNGLVISTWFDLSLTDVQAWISFHVVTSLVTLVLIVIKIAFHWRWIVRVVRQPLFPQPVPISVTPVKNSAAMSRRDFLRLMGIVGSASLLAVHSALNDGNTVLAEVLPTSTPGQLDNSQESLPEQQPSASTGNDLASTSPSTTSNGTTTLSWGTSNCVVRCDRNCSFPGHCHRFQDTNGDNICDESQCI